jgi:cytochrome c
MDRRFHRLSGIFAIAFAGASLAMTAPAAAGDAAHGKSVFATQCALCHTANKGGNTILGPNLYGVVGRKAGTLPGYSYSSSMKAAGGVWSDERLVAYLPAPRTMISGTKMTYGGLKNPVQVQDLVAYLDTLK